MTKLILIAWLSAHAADASTTHLALNRGLHEHFLTQNPWANDAIIGSQAAALWIATERIREDHPKLAWTIRIAEGSIHAYAAVHNIRQMREGSVHHGT